MRLAELKPSELWNCWRERYPDGYSVMWSAVREIKRLAADGVPNYAILEVMLRASESPESLLKDFDELVIFDELECQLELVKRLWPDQRMPAAYYTYIDFSDGAGLPIPGLSEKYAAAVAELRGYCEQALGASIFDNRAGSAARSAARQRKVDTAPRFRFVE